MRIRGMTNLKRPSCATVCVRFVGLSIGRGEESGNAIFRHRGSTWWSLVDERERGAD